jgi:hypothetical protein
LEKSRSSVKHTSDSDGDSMESNDLGRTPKFMKEIARKKSAGLQGTETENRADRKDPESISSSITSLQKEMKVNKRNKPGVPPNVDMNEVPVSGMLKSSQEPEDDAPGYDDESKEEFVARLDAEEENYVKEKKKPSKRTRSIAASTRSDTGSRKSPSKTSKLTPNRKRQRTRSTKSTSASSTEQVNRRLARLEKLIRLQALKSLRQQVIDEDEDDDAGDDIPPEEKEEMSDDDDEDQGDQQEDGDEDDDMDEEEDSEDDEDDDEDDDDEDDSDYPPRPRKLVPLTKKGRIARDTLTNHFGDLEVFYPLTFSITRAEREAMLKTAAETESFFPRIKEIERPTKNRNQKEKDRMLYKEVCRLKDMYEIQMAILFNIVNGKQKRAGKQLLNLLDLTLDTARTANVARIRLRSGNAVVDSIMHAEEESVWQKPYRDILSAKAKDAHDLETVTGERFFPSNQGRLHKWGKLSGRWNAPSSRAGSRGGGAPPQSRSYSPGGFPPFAAARQSSGTTQFANKHRGPKGKQIRHNSEPPPPGSRRT